MVVVIDGLAASGGYITALAADHIIAQETSLVGSIGVLFQYPNVTDLLKTLGIKVEEIKSSPLKAAPNGFEPTSPGGARGDRVDRLGFLRLVPRPGEDAPRSSTTRRLERVADGRVFTGRQGVELKLVDELGDEKTALAWLAKEKNIDPDTPVRDYRLRDGSATCRSCIPRPWWRSTPWGSARSRGASRNGARCRRSSGSTLTVSWPFGTLRSANSVGERQPESCSPRDQGSGGSDDQVRARAAHLRRRIRTSISATSRTSSTPFSARSSRRWRAATASSCAASALSRSRTGRPAPAAIRAPARMSRSRRSPCRSSRPARKCASGSTARSRRSGTRMPAARHALTGRCDRWCRSRIASSSRVRAGEPAGGRGLVRSLRPRATRLTRSLPLFALILVLVIGGVVVGGVAAWLRQGKWRRAARLAQAEARELRAEVDRLKRARRRAFPPSRCRRTTRRGSPSRRRRRERQPSPNSWPFSCAMNLPTAWWPALTSHGPMIDRDLR